MKVKDPVCNMIIDSEAVATSTYKDATYYFCSMSCKEDFDKEPESFAGLSRVPMKAVSSESAVYTCPMHPQIVHNAPGSCPICGMALEAKTVTAEEKANPELIDMTRRFKVSLVLTIPLVLIAMRHHIPGLSAIDHIAPAWIMRWLEPVLATPIVLWGAWPFFMRGWRSVVTSNLNMFTLIGLGVGIAYTYSLVAAFFPGLFPASFRGQGGEVGVYFAPAADVAMESADVTLIKGDLLGIVRARLLSRMTMRNIKQNLFFAFVYNSIGVPIAAGILYPFFGILLSPVIAAAAMSFSSVSVIANALRLRRIKL